MSKLSLEEQVKIIRKVLGNKAKAKAKSTPKAKAKKEERINVSLLPESLRDLVKGQ